jgi:hypothetical protein
VLVDGVVCSTWDGATCPGIDLNTGQVELNTALSKIRAAVNMPLRTARPGECSARKAAVTEPRCRSIPA